MGPGRLTANLMSASRHRRVSEVLYLKADVGRVDAAHRYWNTNYLFGPALTITLFSPIADLVKLARQIVFL